MWDGSQRLEIPVPVSGTENVMIPVIRVVVRTPDGGSILLQRRDAASEPVRGHLEIPGGRWRTGESPLAAARREVHEETGIRLLSVDGITEDRIDPERTIATVKPLAVIAGTAGAFPAIHIVLTGIGEGIPTNEAGATTDVRWWSLEDVRNELVTDRAGFVPSSFAAIDAFLAS